MGGNWLCMVAATAAYEYGPSFLLFFFFWIRNLDKLSIDRNMIQIRYIFEHLVSYNMGGVDTSLSIKHFKSFCFKSLKFEVWRVWCLLKFCIFQISWPTIAKSRIIKKSRSWFSLVRVTCCFLEVFFFDSLYYFISIFCALLAFKKNILCFA